MEQTPKLTDADEETLNLGAEGCKISAKQREQLLYDLVGQRPMLHWIPFLFFGLLHLFSIEISFTGTVSLSRTPACVGVHLRHIIVMPGHINLVTLMCHQVLTLQHQDPSPLLFLRRWTPLLSTEQGLPWFFRGGIELSTPLPEDSAAEVRAIKKQRNGFILDPIRFEPRC
jgi:hypothetical protein